MGDTNYMLVHLGVPVAELVLMVSVKTDFVIVGEQFLKRVRLIFSSGKIYVFVVFFDEKK